MPGIGEIPGIEWEVVLSARGGGLGCAVFGGGIWGDLSDFLGNWVGVWGRIEEELGIDERT